MQFVERQMFEHRLVGGEEERHTSMSERRDEQAWSGGSKGVSRKRELWGTGPCGPL